MYSEIKFLLPIGIEIFVCSFWFVSGGGGKGCRCVYRFIEFLYVYEYLVGIWVRCMSVYLYVDIGTI